jgi:hypothetical protein
MNTECVFDAPLSHRLDVKDSDAFFIAEISYIDDDDRHGEIRFERQLQRSPTRLHSHSHVPANPTSATIILSSLDDMSADAEGAL